MSFPSFATGEVLTAADMNAVGLWLVKSQTVGTGVSSVTVTGAFSADYDAYQVIYSNGVMSADTALVCQIGGAVTGYYGAYTYGSYTGTGPFVAGDNNNTRFTYCGGGDSSGAAAMFTLNNPFLSKQTFINAPVAYSTNVGNFVGRLADTSSYTSITIGPFTGTMTGGTIRIYGFRK